MTQPEPANPDAAPPEAVEESAAEPTTGSRRGRRSPNRRPARVLALEILYETDVAHHHPSEVLSRRSDELQAADEVAAYARELLSGVLEHRRELDAIIQARATAWPVAQMAAIDRNILRLALFECLYNRDTVPMKVAINEAVELAKRYGSDNSPRFVNGVIGRAVDSALDESETRPANQDPKTQEG